MTRTTTSRFSGRASFVRLRRNTALFLLVRRWLDRGAANLPVEVVLRRVADGFPNFPPFLGESCRVHATWMQHGRRPVSRRRKEASAAATKRRHKGYDWREVAPAVRPPTGSEIAALQLRNIAIRRAEAGSYDRRA